MSEEGRYRYKNKRPKNYHDFDEPGVSLAGDSPVPAVFQSAAKNLLQRQARHERLNILCRAVTIESKRIILLLHTTAIKESTEQVVQEANERISKLIEGPLRTIGLNLDFQPAHLDNRAVAEGFHEFVKVQNELYFTMRANNEAGDEWLVATRLPEVDYIRSLGELTDDMVRRCINCISIGEPEECLLACQAARDIYTGFLGISDGTRGVTRLEAAIRDNVLQAESLYYAVCMRHGPAGPLPAPLPASLPAPLPAPLPLEDMEEEPDESDEGFF